MAPMQLKGRQALGGIPKEAALPFRAIQSIVVVSLAMPADV